jgi:N-acetylglucosaminyldiphosphoundecaprenol N-acetyl-beta-D-mannosaminyltransferase
VLRGLPSVALAGVCVHDVTLREAVTVIAGVLESGSRGYVVTPNAHHIVLLHRDRALRDPYDRALLRLPDGASLLWASRLLRTPLRERVTGADLLPALCEVAASRGYSVFLLGGRKGVAPRAAARLRAAYPGLRIVGTHTPPDRFAQDARAVQEALHVVNRARPDILFVGLGAPLQELWVHRVWDQLKVSVAVCCGAALDFAAGTKPRAPLWVRRAGLEWLWRLAHEPRRLWRRYLVQDLAFVGIVLREWWQRRLGSTERA